MRVRGIGRRSDANGAINNGSIQSVTADRSLLLRAINYGDPATGISADAELIMSKQDPLSDPRCLCGRGVTTRRIFNRTERVRAVLQIYPGTQRTDALLLAKLPGGEYLLKLEAASGRNVAGRALRFVVE